MARKAGSRVKIYADEPYSSQAGPVRTDPFSPWQLLIEETRARDDIDLSIRALAKKAEVNPSTLFNWLRSKSGGPLRYAYTANINRRLARALDLEPEVLADAYNRSAFKPVDPQANEPARAPRPAPENLQESSTVYTVDGLKRYLALLEATGQTSFTLDQLKALSGFILANPAAGKSSSDLTP